MSILHCVSARSVNINRFAAGIIFTQKTVITFYTTNTAISHTHTLNKMLLVEMFCLLISYSNKRYYRQSTANNNTLSGSFSYFKDIHLGGKWIRQPLFLQRPVQWAWQEGWIWLRDGPTVWHSHRLRRIAVPVEEWRQRAEQTTADIVRVLVTHTKWLSEVQRWQT